jgi:hypothetical protein
LGALHPADLRAALLTLQEFACSQTIRVKITDDDSGGISQPYLHTLEEAKEEVQKFAQGHRFGNGDSGT